MKLTDSDVAFLKSIGETDPEDIAQVEKATTKTRYTLYDKSNGSTKQIGLHQAIELLGREAFLSGLDRSAFHWDSIRESADGRYTVGFDSRALFKV